MSVNGKAQVAPKSRDAGDTMTRVLPVAKAHIINIDGLPATSAKPVDEDKRFTGAGAISPPFDPDTLCELFDHSNSLRQNVEAYMTNIDSFGHRFEPIISTDDDEAAREMVRDALFLEAAHDKLDESDDSNDFSQVSESEMPSDDEVDRRLRQLKIEMRLEKAMLDNFFSFCCADSSFVNLRRINRQDLEAIGNGYWEVLRNRRGDVAQFNYLPGFTVRLLPLSQEFFDVDIVVQISKLRTEKRPMKKRFRKYVQVVESGICFFKDLGDPRTISRKTGKTYKSLQLLRRAEGQDAEEAHELIHWSIHNPKSSYGVPRWIGNLLSVLGSRQAEEVNFLYFDNKGVPPLAICVSGGRMQQESVNRIRDFIKTNIQGRQNFHSVLVIEAESGSTKGDTAGRARIDLKPLTAAQNSDALFQKYDERNIDKVGMSFRLPRMLRGDIRDFNRATARSALAFAEMQVFQPERESFDFIVNRRILANELGVKYWRFVSNAPITRDPGEMSEIIRNLANANVITPKLGLELAQDVFNRDFKPSDEDWVNRPLQLTIAQLGQDDVFLSDKSDLDGADLGSAGLRRPQQGNRFLKLPPGIGKSENSDSESIRKAVSHIREALEQMHRHACDQESVSAHEEHKLLQNSWSEEATT